MRLHGIHHYTAVTANGPANAAFYGGVLGLRLVKKTVNFDDPGAYHLYYGDAVGSPGTALTFFEYPGARRGQPGAGMIDRLDWSVPDRAALDWWEAQLVGQAETEREDDALVVRDPEGMVLRLVPDAQALSLPHAEAPHVPAAVALRRMTGVRARTTDPSRSAASLEALGFVADGPGRWRTGTGVRSAAYELIAVDDGPGLAGAGTTHHVAWASLDSEHDDWWAQAAQAQLRPTPVIDRDYFHAIYFREPSGVLFEVATDGPGFDVDEPRAELGRSLRIPAQHAHLQALLEQRLTPIPDPWEQHR